eukprot:TRINITY_DN2013_c0_g1_i1.p1 TRINITY_DN2013_c0_g1~~TRINITY_DN2013_c0_g1_i1.p1  ORF type:complete len:240 (-),score=36.71 TRINITY_DN2013_c0_g1_i1:87-806(-)
MGESENRIRIVRVLVCSVLCGVLCAALARCGTDPRTEQSVLNAMGSSFKVNNYVVFYVYFTNGTITKKAAFFPQVDVLARLQIKEFQNYTSYGGLDSEGNSLQMDVWGSFMGQFLSLKRFSTGERFVGYYSVRIKLVKGVFESLSWDGDCSSCGNAKCLDDSCTYAVSDCSDTAKMEDDPGFCSLRIYVGWEGTDKNGKKLLSAGKLPSKFNQYNFNGLIQDSAAGFYTDWAPTGPAPN